MKPDRTSVGYAGIVDTRTKISGAAVVGLGLLFMASALVGAREGEITALRPVGAPIYASEQPEAFERRVRQQLSLGMLCLVGGAGYLWWFRSRD